MVKNTVPSPKMRLSLASWLMFLQSEDQSSVHARCVISVRENGKEILKLYREAFFHTFLHIILFLWEIWNLSIWIKMETGNTILKIEYMHY